MSGTHGGFAAGFALVLVLFVLLVIIGGDKNRLLISEKEQVNMADDTVISLQTKKKFTCLSNDRYFFVF